MSEHASTHSTERLDIRPWSMAKVALPVSLGIFVQFIVVVIDDCCMHSLLIMMISIMLIMTGSFMIDHRLGS